MKKHIFLLILCLFASFGIYADVTMAQADEAYNKGDYVSAVKIYEEVISAEGTSPEILYNLGNAYIKTDNYGAAVMAYLEAQRLDPSSSGIRGNLEYAQSKVTDRNRALQKGKDLDLEPSVGGFFHILYTSAVGRLSSDTWATLAVVAFILLLSGVALYIFSGSTLVRKIGFFGGIVMLVATLACNVFAYSVRSSARSNTVCVIKEYTASLHSEPRDDAKTVATPLSSGTAMEILEKKKDDSGEQWYKVKLNNDYIGWLPATSLHIL